MDGFNAKALNSMPTLPLVPPSNATVSSRTSTLVSDVPMRVISASVLDISISPSFMLMMTRPLKSL